MGFPDTDTSIKMNFSVGVVPWLTGQVNCRQPDKIIVAQYFSINSENPAKILINALKTDAIDSLLSYPELYLIGVEVDA